VQPTGLLAGIDDGRVGAARPLAPYDLAAPPRVYGRSRTVALLRRNAPGARTGPSFDVAQRVAVAVGGTDGSLGARQVLAGAVAPHLGDADLAVNDGGDAVAVWIQSRGTTSRGIAVSDRLWISVRRAGGSFGRPTVLVGSGRIGSVDAAVGVTGDILVAFTRQAIVRGRERGPRQVEVRYRRAGHGFEALAAIGPNAGFADIDTAIASNGRAYVAWGTQDLGEEANLPFRVYAAVKPPGPHGFRQGALLDDGGGVLGRPIGNVSIGIAPNADATVAWSGVRTSRATGELQVFYPVLAATTDPSGRFAAAQPVAGGNGGVGGVVVSGNTGLATVVWTASRPGTFDGPTAVLAATRAGAGAAAPFGAAETVSDQPPGSNDNVPAIALDPGTDQPVVAFTGPNGRGMLVSARAGLSR
jgi:hypothetical protein